MNQRRPEGSAADPPSVGGGAPAPADVRIHVMSYGAAGVQEQEVPTLAAAMPLPPAPAVTWINVDGLTRLDIVEMAGHYFDIHPLVLEDILTLDQRAKFEDYGHYAFVVAKMLYYQGAAENVRVEQVSIILGENYVISFLEDEGDVFGPVRERIRSGKGRICQQGADYLAYALLDAVVDSYFDVLERIGEHIEGLEDKLITHPGREPLQAIHRLKRDIIFLRKAVWPLREVVAALERGESPLIQPATEVYLRDVYDHTVQLIDTIETFRDMLAGMLDIYLSSISNRTNEVMKVLTIIATIFIPLTFLAGVYGMNFKYMPELSRPWAYPLLWLIMISVGVTMLILFRRRKWL